MKRKGIRINLSVQVFAVLTAFFLCIVAQFVLRQYQTDKVIIPHNEMIQEIQEISQFLQAHEESMHSLNEFHWDYDNIFTLELDVTTSCLTAKNHLARFSTPDINNNRRQYLLNKATRELFNTYQDLNDKFFLLLRSGKNAEASELYYNNIYYCGNYILETTQNLLETIISDTNELFILSMETNTKISQWNTIILLFTGFFAFLLFIILYRLLKYVRILSRQANDLASGSFQIPDMKETSQTEIGDMARAFNSMKHFMKNQMNVLEEKNRIQTELYEKESETLKLKNLLEQEKLQALRSQINPHFLFNTINVIKMEANTEKAEKTEDMLNSLALLYRYALGQNSMEVPLSRELRIIMALGSLYKARFGDSFTMSWKSFIQEDLTEVMVPSFILQPLVENAYQHGFSKRGYGRIEVFIREEKDVLILTVEDDGIGLSPDKLEEVKKKLITAENGDHVGLFNVAARIQTKNGEILMDSVEGKGSIVTIRIPLVIKKEEEE